MAMLDDSCVRRAARACCARGVGCDRCCVEEVAREGEGGRRGVQSIANSSPSPLSLSHRWRQSERLHPTIIARLGRVRLRQLQRLWGSLLLLLLRLSSPLPLSFSLRLCKDLCSSLPSLVARRRPLRAHTTDHLLTPTVDRASFPLPSPPHLRHTLTLSSIA